MLIIWFPKLITVVAASALLFCNPAHCETNHISPHIVTNFVDGAKLSPEQVHTILQLAAKAGLKEPGEIQTFRYIPSVTIGIRVRSVNNRNGRLSKNEEMTLSSSKFTALPARDGALRLGDFWVNPPYVKTNHLLSVTINGKRKDIGISEEISIETADTIIDRLINASVKFASADDTELANEFRSLNMADLYSLHYDRTTSEYEILTGRGNIVHAIHCKLVDGQVLILSVVSPIF